MKTKLLLIRMAGIMNLLTAGLHLTLWERMDWTNELAKLSIKNNNVMQMINLCIIIFFVYVGLLLLLKPSKILSTGRHFLGLLCVLWTARTGMQFYFPEGNLIFVGVAVFVLFCLSYPLLTTIQIKSKLDNGEPLKHDWKAHELLKDFEIEDVWTLPIEMDEKHSIADLQKTFTLAIEEISRSGIAGLLFQIRFSLGRLFGWDDKVDTVVKLPKGSIRERYAQLNELNADDFTVQKEAQFVPIYQMKNEALSEIENETVHAAVHYGKVAVDKGRYQVQMTVYVKPKGLFGALYMKLISPFRLFLVYPVMLRVIGKLWNRKQQSVTTNELKLA